MRKIPDRKTCRLAATALANTMGLRHLAPAEGYKDWYLAENVWWRLWHVCVATATRKVTDIVLADRDAKLVTHKQIFDFLLDSTTPSL